MQDTPAIKVTYTAKITVADPYVVYASGAFSSKKSKDGKTSYTYS